MTLAHEESPSRARSAYSYRALAEDGRVTRGRLDAASLNDARAVLRRRALVPLEVAVIASARRRWPVPARDLAVGLRILGDLLDAGLPMARALSALLELAPPSWRPGVPALQELVREGRSLAMAFSDGPLAIPPLVVGITAAGEAGSGTAPAVRRAAELVETQAAAREAARSALTYPAILAVAGSISISLMVTLVLPRFAVILGDLGQSLPISTQLVLRSASLARAVFLPACVVAALFSVAFGAWRGSTAGRQQLHGLLLHVPALGSFRAAAATARATYSLSALLESGVPIRRALGFAAVASADAEVERRILIARGRIASGESLAAALSRERALTPVALRLLAAGEESGRLAGMLGHAAKLEQERSDRMLRSAVKLVEPALIMVFAGLIGFVAAALLQAVYAVRPT